MWCCVRCLPCCCKGEPDAKLVVDERNRLRDDALSEWGKIGVSLQGDIDHIDLGTMKKVVDDLHTINEALPGRIAAARKKAIVASLFSKFLFSMIIVCGIASAFFLGISAATSCADGMAATWISITAGIVGSFIAVITLVFQELHDSVKEDKIYYDTLREQEIRDDRVVREITHLLHDFRNLHQVSVAANVNLVRPLLTEVGQKAAGEDCYSVPDAKQRILDACKKEYKDLPTAYKQGNLLERAFNAIARADEIARLRERRGVFGDNMNDIVEDIESEDWQSNILDHQGFSNFGINSDYLNRSENAI